MSRGHKKRSGNKSGRGGKRERDRRRYGTSTNGVDYTGATKLGCSSGKWGWVDTEAGREGVRTLKRALRRVGGNGVREYLCAECGRWHVGHMPRSVRKGHLSTRDIYGRAES